MRNKKILLVEDNYQDIIAIQDALKSLNGQHSLHVVHNINDALQVLMGGSSPYGMENYSQTGKVRPDIVLLNISFLQESAREFLEVINKYYSLKNIRVFITGHSNEQLDPALAEKYGIAGYLSKPIDLQDTMNESVVTFRQELLKPGKALFSLPLLAFNNKVATIVNYLKAKSFFLYLGNTVATKVTVSVVAAVFAATVLNSSTAEEPKEVELTARPQVAGNAWQLMPTVEACTEQEAIVAAESIGLPELLENSVAVLPDRKTAAEPIAISPTPQPRLAEQTPRKYRIVAIEEAETLEETQ